MRRMGAVTSVNVEGGWWTSLLALVLLTAACSAGTPESSGSPDGSDPPVDIPATTASGLRSAAERVESGDAVDIFAAIAAEVLIEGTARTPSPATATDVVGALSQLDWSGILATSNPTQIGSRLEREALRALATDLRAAAASAAGSGPLSPRASTRHRPDAAAAYGLLLDPVSETRTVAEGTKSGTVGMEADRTFDESSGRETTTWSVDGDITDSETGERVTAHTEGEAYHDVCWGEDGAREGGVATATGVTTDGPKGVETSEQSRKTTVRRDADGSITVSVSVTVGDYTIGYTKSGSDMPGTETDYASEDGDRYTHTFETENGEMTVSVDKDVTWSDDGFQEALDEFSDPEKVADDTELIAESMKSPISPSIPGADEFCLKLTVDPTSGALEADGDTLSFNATVLDWNDRPVVSAIVTVEGAKLGSVAPKLGPTGTDGRWTSTYTSGDPGTETLTFEASRFGYNVRRDTSVTIGTGYAFDWSRSQSGQTATVNARSCDGTSWTGEFTFDGTPGGAEISMSATFDLQMDDAVGETDLVSTGTIGTAGTYLPMEMPYKLTITLDAENRTADVQFNRAGGGVVVAEGRRLPIPTEGFPEFAFTTPLDPPTGCP